MKLEEEGEYVIVSDVNPEVVEKVKEEAKPIIEAKAETKKIIGLDESELERSSEEPMPSRIKPPNEFFTKYADHSIVIPVFVGYLLVLFVFKFGSLIIK